MDTPGAEPSPEIAADDSDLGEEPPSMDAPIEGAAETGLAEPEQAKADNATGSAITGRYNSSPIGDIKLTKAAKTYNTYRLELSMGQLEIIMHALEQNHSDVVGDELLSTFQFYLTKLPGPGEEEEEAEARNNPQAAAAKAAGGAGALPGEETPIPMPPGQEAGGGKDLASLPKPPGGAGGPAEPPGKARMMKNAGSRPKGRPGLPGPDTEPAARKMNQELPPPPSE